MGEVVQAVESDVALVITVLRIANPTAQRKKGKIREHPGGGRDPHAGGSVETLAARTATFDFFERTPVGPDAGALSASCGRDPDGRGPARARARVRRPRPGAVLGLLHDVGKLVLHARVSGLPVADPRRAHARRSASTRSASSSGWTTRSWAACSLGAGRCRTGSRRRSSSITPTTSTARPRSSARRHAGPLRARPNREPQAAPRAARVQTVTEQLRSVMYELPRGSGQAKRNVDPCPALDARGGAEAAGRGQGLQADRARARALDEHGAHPPPHNTYAKPARSTARRRLIATERGWI